MAKSYLNLSNPTNTVKSMSFYRISDAPPDWAQNDPSQPDYIANKDLAEIQVLVDGEEFAQNSKDIVEPIEFRSGQNVHLEASTEIDETAPNGKLKKVITVHAVASGTKERNVYVENEKIDGDINIKGEGNVSLSTINQDGKTTINIAAHSEDTLRPISINGTNFLDNTVQSGGLDFVAGRNIDLAVRGNSIVINSTASGEEGGGDCQEFIEGEGVDLIYDDLTNKTTISLEKSFITDEYVKSISTTKLIQEQGTTLILNGGNANGEYD